MSVRSIEINEAINAGEYLLSVIDEVLVNINKARNWGIVDMFMDNSFISTIIKHDKLHKANDLIPELQEALNRFNRELKDVEIYFQTKEIKMSTTLEIIDCFFDSFLVDGYTFMKIVDSKKELQQLQEQVQNVLNELRHIY